MIKIERCGGRKVIILTDEDYRRVTIDTPKISNFKISTDDINTASFIIYINTKGEPTVLKQRYCDTKIYYNDKDIIQ